MNTIAILEARRTAAHAPQRQRRFGGHDLFEWVVRRVTECQRLERVVVVAGTGLTADDIRPLVPPGVAVCGEPGTSLAERYLRIAEQHGAGGVVRVATDQPLVDPVSIDRLIAAAAEPPHCDYMSFQAGDALPSGSSPLGLFAEWFRVDALCRAQPLAEPGCEHVTACLYQNPDRFHLRLIPLPAEMERFGLRLLDDDEEAWEQAQVLFDCLGPDQLEWHRIAGLLGMNAADAALAASTASYDAD